MYNLSHIHTKVKQSERKAIEEAMQRFKTPIKPIPMAKGNSFTCSIVPHYFIEEEV